MTARRDGPPEGYRRVGDLLVPTALAEAVGESGRQKPDGPGARPGDSSRWKDASGPMGAARELYWDTLEGLSSRVGGHD